MYKGLRLHIIKLKQEKILKFLLNESIGKKVHKDQIEIINVNNYANIDPNASYFYYAGPLDEKTRDFCAEMLVAGKLYSQEEMDYLSFQLGYNVDLYMGSYNCRHRWVRARIKGKIKDGTLDESLIADNTDARNAADAQSGALKG